MSTRHDSDIIIVGGGPAGAATAGLLAKRGHHPLVLEREAFPRYHVGESMITGIISVIKELGLEERLDAMGFERKYGLSLVWGRERGLWNIAFREAGGPYEYSYHVDRSRFDELLLSRARELGAEVEEESVVSEPILNDNRVTGVRYTRGGERHEAYGSVIIDASGQSRAVTRHLVDVDWNSELRNLAIWTYYENCQRLEGEKRSHILVEKVQEDDGWFWSIPLGESRMSVGYVAPTGVIQGRANDRSNVFCEKLGQTKYTRGLLEEAHTVEEFRTTRDWSYMARSFHGAGWASVGDSSCFIDPLLSSGVCIGMLCALPLAQAVDIAIRDAAKAEAAFERYSQGCRDFANAILEYVRFFYDQQRDREDYLERAAAIANAPAFQSPEKGFVALISGIAGMGPIFRIGELRQSRETGL